MYCLQYLVISVYFCTASLNLYLFLIAQKYLQFLCVTYLCYYFLLHTYLVNLQQTWFKLVSLSLLINILIATGLIAYTFYATENEASKIPCKQVYWLVLHGLSMYPPAVLFIVSYRLSKRLKQLQLEAKFIVMKHRQNMLWALFWLVIVVSVISIAHNSYLYFRSTNSCDHFFATTTEWRQLLNAALYLVSVYTTDFSVMFLLLYIFWEKKTEAFQQDDTVDETDFAKALKVRGSHKSSKKLELSPTNSTGKLMNWPMFESRTSLNA